MHVTYPPQMQDETERRYVFMAIKGNKTAAAARSFLNALHKATPLRHF